MAGRQYPYVWADVPWSEWQEFTRGRHDGLHLLSWGRGPRAKMATYRQLRAMGRRPGGKEPVAVVYFTCRKALKKTYAYLYLIADSKPVRPMTPAKWAAIDKALAARRTCRQCRVDAEVELPRAHRTCEPCRYALGLLEVDDYLHEYLVGEPTFAPTELASLPTLAAELAALPPEASASPRAAQRWGGGRVMQMQQMWIQIVELGLLPIGLAAGYAMGRRTVRDEAAIDPFALSPNELRAVEAAEAGLTVALARDVADWRAA